MELKNKTVKHIFYGEGTIVNQTEKTILVRYADKEESYPFPKSFLNHSLSLLPATLNVLLLRELNESGYSDTNVEKVKGAEPTQHRLERDIYAERTVLAHTNAEFLNSEFGTHFKGFQRSGYPLNRSTLVWMVVIDGTEHYGWANKWSNRYDVIEERYVLNDKSSIDLTVIEKYRIVAEKDFSTRVHKYHVRGLFKYDEAQSTPYKHIWRKIK